MPLRIRVRASFFLMTCLILTPALGGDSGEAERNWPQWRGPQMNGIALHGSPPVEWSEDRNVAWKVPIPGRGSSTPIIWQDRIFIQSAVPAGSDLESRQELQDWQRDGRSIYSAQRAGRSQGESYLPADKRQRFVIIAYDRGTGRTLWERTLNKEQPHEGIHPTNTWASGSPVTDGEHLVAFFGSWGLYCLDLDGNVLWSKDLGSMTTRNGWGEGTSPALSGNTVVVNWDHEGGSFLAAFDKRTGQEKWRQSREEVTSWFTPLVVTFEGRRQIITGGAGQVRGYDLETGALLWHGPGLTVNSIPTPVFDKGRVYLTSGYRRNVLLAVDLARAEGDIEAAGAILWRYDRDTPYVASPLLYGDSIYFVKHLRGILTSLDTGSGKRNYGPVRIGELKGVYASPVGADGRVYMAGREGTTMVLEHGNEYKVLAINRLDDGFDASPAVVGNELYLRGSSFLYRISQD